MGKEDMVHTYNGILLNHKNEIIRFAVTWMDLEIIILSKPERQIMILLTYGILKNDTNGHIKIHPQT